jgi:hypothetical protein
MPLRVFSCGSLMASTCNKDNFNAFQPATSRFFFGTRSISSQGISHPFGRNARTWVVDRSLQIEEVYDPGRREHRSDSWA